MKKLLILFVMILTMNSEAQQGNGIVARYSFNKGTAENEIGGNNAIARGLVLTDDRFGNPGSAYFFQGNFDSYLNLGTSPDIKPKKGSVSLWFNIDWEIYKGKGVFSNPIIYTRAFAGEDFNEAYSIGYCFNMKKLSGNLSKSEESQVYLVPLNKIYFRRWYHVVLTYDNDYASLYVDGKLASRAAKNFETHFLESDSVIVGGQLGKKNSRYFLGSIDDIEIYNKVLSPGEVLQLYNAPNPNEKAIVLKWIGISALIIIIILLIVWWVRWRIMRAVNAEKEKSRLHSRILNLETRAIRAQMNPHFVFNALNTLQRFILENKNDLSYTYLIEFSRLLRKLLESSESDTISLKEEIEILTAYLDIEKLRFDHSFEYQIISTIQQPGQVHIPFMLVQPFAENAIWHGLLNKEGLRFLKISFTEADEKRIVCEIDDNGVGRDFKIKADDTIKKKSLAMDFVRQRLELLQQSTGIGCSLEVVDKKDIDQKSLGTTVKIIIPKSN